MCGQESLLGPAMELSLRLEVAGGSTVGTSFIQKTFIEYLLCANHCSNCGDTAVNKTDRNLCLRGNDFLVGGDKCCGERQAGDRCHLSRDLEEEREWATWIFWGKLVLNVKVASLLLNKLF